LGERRCRRSIPSHVEQPRPPLPGRTGGGPVRSRPGRGARPRRPGVPPSPSAGLGGEGGPPGGSQGPPPCSPPTSDASPAERRLQTQQTRPERWGRQSSKVLTGGRKTSTDTSQLFGDGGSGRGRFAAADANCNLCFANEPRTGSVRAPCPPRPSPPLPGGALGGRGTASGESRHFSAIRYSVF